MRAKLKVYGRCERESVWDLVSKETMVWAGGAFPTYEAQFPPALAQFRATKSAKQGLGWPVPGAFSTGKSRPLYHGSACTANLCILPASRPHLPSHLPGGPPSQRLRLHEGMTSLLTVQGPARKNTHTVANANAIASPSPNLTHPHASPHPIPSTSHTPSVAPSPPAALT